MTLTNKASEDAEFLIFSICPYKIVTNRTFHNSSLPMVLEIYNNSIDVMIFTLLKEWARILKLPFMEALKETTELSDSKNIFSVFIWLLEGLNPSSPKVKYEHLALVVPFVFGMSEHHNPIIREYGINALSNGLCKVFRPSLIFQMSLDTLIFSCIENNLLIHQNNFPLSKESLLLFFSFFSSYNTTTTTFTRYTSILDIILKNFLLIESNNPMIKEYIKAMTTITMYLGRGISIRFSIILDGLIELGLRNGSIYYYDDDDDDDLIACLLHQLEKNVPILTIKYEEKISSIRNFLNKK